MELKKVWQLLSGGWRTWGPNSGVVPGGFDGGSTVYEAVSADAALTMSAVWACVHLRAESFASMPLHLYDQKNNLIVDHDLYALLHESPNSMQTAPEFWSMMSAHEDMYGEAICVVKRNSKGAPVSLMPFDEPNNVALNPSGRGYGWVYEYGKDRYSPDDILHFKGFTMGGLRGIPRLEAGRRILSAQLQADESAIQAFKQSMKTGGFFKMDRDLDPEQRRELEKILARHASPENSGKMLALMKGMEPVSGKEYRLRPVDAELLASRHFGVEEVCRLYNMPPPLIGHTDKASSWASSLEQVQIFYEVYSLLPSVVRKEARIKKTLLTIGDKAKKLSPKWSMEGLKRADLQTRKDFYATMLDKGAFCVNEVRALENRAAIPGGDEYHIQTNMGAIGDKPSANNGGKGKDNA